MTSSCERAEAGLLVNSRVTLVPGTGYIVGLGLGKGILPGILRVWPISSEDVVKFDFRSLVLIGLASPVQICNVDVRTIAHTVKSIMMGL